ncbi:MAG: hypothetical protein ACI4WY_07265 [Anaerovoracaceae bacterium]
MKFLDTWERKTVRTGGEAPLVAVITKYRFCAEHSAYGESRSLEGL